ncbi:unnamed protein product [Cylicostephanus goldi]|uniref:Uncharacterized protein n=1 Tax=Cylicostephanus goldi TaxID=71465 RepID=A0A3P7N2J5_CYLGO|nr:unnamed protein product [Cylicostephanus goldi]
MLGRILPVQAAQAPDDTSVSMFSDTSKLEDDDGSGVRERFHEVDLPKSVFVNETVTAKVTVVALNIERETTVSLSF